MPKSLKQSQSRFQLDDKIINHDIADANNAQLLGDNQLTVEDDNPGRN